jgi:hypothetical protein
MLKLEFSTIIMTYINHIELMIEIIFLDEKLTNFILSVLLGLTVIFKNKLSTNSDF